MAMKALIRMYVLSILTLHELFVQELVCDARRLVEKFNHTLELELARVSRKEEEIAAQRPAELPKIKVERSGGIYFLVQRPSNCFRC